MKNKMLMLLSAAVVSLGTAAPSFADGGPISSATGFVGMTTAEVVDIPEGMILHGLYYGPKGFSHKLAESFGDENGWKQRIVGAVIGIPTGMVFGVPYGAVHGMCHAWNSGWDKPFSTESYIVTEEK